MEIVKGAKGHVGPKVRFPSVASLLKMLPRASANASILRLNECFQQGYIFIFKVSTNQKIFIPSKSQVPNHVLGAHGTVQLELSLANQPSVTMACGL